MIASRIQPVLMRRSRKRVFAGARITCKMSHVSHEFVSIQFVSQSNQISKSFKFKNSEYTSVSMFTNQLNNCNFFPREFPPFLYNQFTKITSLCQTDALVRPRTLVDLIFVFGRGYIHFGDLLPRACAPGIPFFGVRLGLSWG
jgi:hypothetical protein